jgi:hypothetical protein
MPFGQYGQCRDFGEIRRPAAIAAASSAAEISAAPVDAA